MKKAIIATYETSRVPEFAGSTWVRLQYMLGLRKLGLETFWVEHLSAVDELKHPHGLEYLKDRFRQTAEYFDFGDHYCIVYDGGKQHFGMSFSELKQVAQETNLVLSIAGRLPVASPLLDIPQRAYVDVDPGYTQIWAQQTEMGLERHNHFFTVGQNVGRPEFTIPIEGINWQTMLPPVALDEWPNCVDERCTRFSTVADWRGSQEAIFEGEYYGIKRSEFIRFLQVPDRTGQRIELALCIGQHDFEDLGLLLGHNWRVRDPSLYTGNPRSYREFVQKSKAEFSVAKSGYVKSKSGWISDRTACYLASGKPAVVQSTGFEWRLPTGKGLLTFSTLDEAVAAINDVNQNYLEHCHAARKIAETHFNAEVVFDAALGQLKI